MREPGFRMQRVIAYVREHPGCTKLAAGTYANARDRRGNPHKAMYILYSPVDRCIARGLLSYSVDKGKYHLYIAETSNV